MSLSAEQVRDVVIAERVASALSLVGAAFVLLTFALNDKFRKPINRLVVYATFGNVITNVGTLISTGGIEAGTGSSLCQFQAFLIQWFMPADALWTFAMACNVWLSFFRSYDTAQLRRLEWKYVVACYGIPFIPAFTFLFTSTHGRGKVYGSAVLWCWVSLKWEFLRVATFYGPVWIVILCTIGIYVRVGAVVFKWRNHLVSVGKHGTTSGTNEFPATGIMKTSEVTVTRTEVMSQPGGAQVISKKPSFLALPDSRSRAIGTQVHRSTGGFDPNKAAMKYCKCAMLFFIALIITWVPSTVNRIYTLIRPSHVVFGLNLAASVVLPLQGFWNAVIYTATSSFAVKCLFRDILDICRRKSPERISIPMRRQTVSSLPSKDIEDSISKRSITTTHYESERSSSQSELVGQAK